MATVLDLKCKLEWFRFWFDNSASMDQTKADDAFDIVRRSVTDIFDEYRSLYGQVREPIGERIPVISSPSGSHSTTTQKRFSTSSRPSKKYQKHIEEKNKMVQDNINEERYLSEPAMPIDEDCDILHWWRSSRFKFPILSLIARDVLTIPITTVPSESAFSTGGRVLSSFRNSLAPETAEALICTQSWMMADALAALGATDDATTDEDTDDEDDTAGTEDPTSYSVVSEVQNEPLKFLNELNEEMVNSRNEKGSGMRQSSFFLLISAR